MVDKGLVAKLGAAFKELPERKTDKWQMFLFWGWSFFGKYVLGPVPGTDEYLDRFIADSNKFYERFKGNEELEWLAFNLISVSREWVDWKTKQVHGGKEPPAKLVWKGMERSAEDRGTDQIA